MPKCRSSHLLALALLACGSWQESAFAQGATQICTFLPNPIILYGTTAVQPVIASFGGRLSQLEPPVSLLYLKQDGCTAVTALSSNSNVAGSAEFYSMVDGKPKIDTCSLGGLGKVFPDVALADVYWETCPESRGAGAPRVRAQAVNGEDGAPAPVDFQGPTQAAVFAVPRVNFSTTHLSLNQVRDVLACGAKGGIFPFVDRGQIFGYMYNAGDQGMKQMTYACLELGLDKLCRENCDPNYDWNGDIASALLRSIKPDTAIGYLSNEVYDLYRDHLKSVAIQGPGQEKAFFPDSDATSRDRLMVRDGHYMVQGPLHMVAMAGPDNVPLSVQARRFANWMQQKPEMPGEATLPFNIIDVFAETGVVPACAMRVIRYTDGGPFTPYRDPQPCGCYFESQATGVAVPCGCNPCKDKSECGQAQVCSYGFCE